MATEGIDKDKISNEVQAAIQYYHDAFPRPLISTDVEYPIIPVNSLYATVSDRAAVDAELTKAMNAHRIRMFGTRATQFMNKKTGRAMHRGDEYMIMVEEDYRAIVQTRIARYDKNAASTTKSSSQTTSDQFTTTESSCRDRSSSPIKVKTTEQSPTIRRKRKASTIDSNSSLKSAPIKKEIKLRGNSRSVPTDASEALHTIVSEPSDPNSDRSLQDDMRILYDAYLTSFLPNHTTPIVSQERLLQLLFPPQLSYRNLMPDDAITMLVQAGFLVRDSIDTYRLAVPNMGRFFREIVESRSEIHTMLRRRQWNEIFLGELESRLRLKSSERGIKWHIHEMIGGGYLSIVDTTRGKLARLPPEFT